jgi:hypothetical protein
MNDFIQIDDVRIAIDKIDYYYPIGNSMTLVVCINQKEIPFEQVCANPSEFRELVEEFDRKVCNTLIYAQNHSNTLTIEF